MEELKLFSSTNSFTLINIKTKSYETHPFCFVPVLPVLPIYAQAVDESQFSRYLFAYFVRSGDLQEYLRFAISRDAINWRALNGNRPVVAVNRNISPCMTCMLKVGLNTKSRK